MLDKMVDGVVVRMSPSEETTFLAQQPATPERRRVAKSVVTQRLIDAGLIDDAFATLGANPSTFARWFAPDSSYVYVDDEEALWLLNTIGADPDVILAP